MSDGTVAAPEAAREWHPAPFVEARGDPLEIRLPDCDGIFAGSAQARRALAHHFGFAVELKPVAAFNRPDGMCVPVRSPRQPVHLMTTRQLALLQALLPDSRIETARFRLNILVDASPRECERLDLARGIVSGPACAITVMEKSRRCGFPALAQPGLPRDGSIIKHLNRMHGLLFGFGCRVASLGTLSLGDELVFEPSASHEAWTSDTVEIELGDGTRLEEVAIEALYGIASGTIRRRGSPALRNALGRDPAQGQRRQGPAEPSRSARRQASSRFRRSSGRGSGRR